MLRSSAPIGRPSDRRRWRPGPWPAPADARNGIKPPARLIGAVPGHDPAVKLQDLRLQHPSWAPRAARQPVRPQAPAGRGIRGDSKELLNTFASHRGYDTELGHVSADGIDHEVCWRMKSWRVRWSIRQLCCSAVLVSTNRMLARSPLRRWPRRQRHRSSVA